MKNYIYNTFPWHDSIIKEIKLDRRIAGYSDTLELLIETIDKKQWEITFVELYEVHAKMNFRVIADESINNVELVHSSEYMEKIKAKWNNMSINLNCYIITTNSTGSILEIYALNMHIKEKEDNSHT